MKPSARAQHTPTEAFLAHAAPLFGGDAPGYAWLAVQQYRQHKAPVILVVQDHTTLQQTLDGLNFLAPELTALPLPAWDVQPYDRQPPDPLIQAQRMAALSALHAGSGQIIVTTVNAVSTRVLPATALPKPLVLTTKTRIQPGALARQLVALGYQRTETVMERGEFAVRGGIVDVFPILDDQPVRLDFFDDALESLKPFDPTTQRSEGSIPEVTCGAAQELILDEERIRAFRHGYRVQLNGSPQDTLYATLSEGTAHDMMLHFLPLFFEDTPLATPFNFSH